MRKINFLRNKEYEYTFKVKSGNEFKDKKVAFEFDFQISNLNIKDFLYFIGLIYPNISSFNTLTEPFKSQMIQIFKNEATIFESIENIKIDENLKKYEYIDIIGVLTTNLFNIEDKKNRQLNKYFLLAKELKEKPEINKKFNFSPNNKKIIIVITNGKYKYFYKNLNKNINKALQINKNYDDIDLIFIYEKFKVGEEQIIQNKYKAKYINLLENALKSKENENLILGNYEKLKFSDLYSNFYKNILISNNAQELKNELAFINKKYIYSLPSIYFKFLNKKIDKDKILDLFLKNVNLKNIVPNNEYINNIKKQFTLIKEKYFTSVSILEITSLELLLKNYQDKQFKILYENIKYENNKTLNATNIDNKFSIWLNRNEFSIKIVVFNTTLDDNNSLFFIWLFNKYFQNDFTLFINENIVYNYISLLKKQYLKFNDEKDLISDNLNKLINSKKYELFLKIKMNHQFNYYDKILKNKIIITDEKDINNNYLENFIYQINQQISIDANMDIAKINDHFVDDKTIKNMIQNLNQFKTEFIENEKKLILDKFNNTQCLIYFMDANIKLEDCLNKKFNLYQNSLDLMYFKFVEIFYSKKIKKIIQKQIINRYVNN